MKIYETFEELQDSTQALDGLALFCRENLYLYITQPSEYVATDDDVTFVNGRVGKASFVADAKYIKTTGGNVQDDIDSIVAGSLPSQANNQFKFLTTNGIGASWGVSAYEVETFAQLEALDPVSEGQSFICQERANARYILRELAYVAQPGDVTFANGRVGELQIDGVANIKWFGLPTNVDDNSLFTDADSRVEGEIFLPKDEYKILGSNVDSIQLFNSNKWRGAGKGKAIITFENPDSTFRKMMKVSAENVSFHNMTFKAEANGGSLAFFNPATNGLRFYNCEFDGAITGAAGSESHIAYCIQIGSVGSIEGLSAEHCEVHHASYWVLQSNTSTATVTKQRYFKNTFHSNYKSDLSFNSPSGEQSDITVIGNTFKDAIREFNVGSHYLGFASAKKWTATNNTFLGALDNPVHIEEASYDFVLSNNIFQVDVSGSFGAISVQDNNIGGSYEMPKRGVISNNVIKKTGVQKLATSVGINMLLDGTGENPADFLTIGGNVVEGFESGIIVTSEPSMGISVIGNNAINCAYGYVTKDRNASIDGNVSTSCDVGIKNDYSVEAVNHRFVNCTESAQNDGRYIVLHNPYFSFGEFSTDGGENVAYKIIGEDVDTRIDGKITISAATSSSSDYATAIKTIGYDGSTLAQSDIYAVPKGGASVSMTQDSGINVRLFTAAARSECTLSVKINGEVAIL
ncbi:MAG: hypothetical protein ABJG42_24800 [Vibrio splendidus]